MNIKNTSPHSTELLTRKQASEFLASELPFRDSQHWYDFLSENVRRSKHVYKVKFIQKGYRYYYSKVSLLAFVQANRNVFIRSGHNVWN